MNTIWTPEKVRKAATKNQKRQQTTKRAVKTPKKETNWLKKETSRKRTRTPKKSPGENFSIGSKQAALQSSSQFDSNRSFLTIDAEYILQSKNAKQFTIDSDSNPIHNVITSNDPSLFMSTSMDSPPIGLENTIDSQTLIPNKSTPKIEKAVANIKATKQDIPKVVFLDNQVEAKIKNRSDQDKEKATIEREQERIRTEQANIITTIPANTDTENQLVRYNKDTTQDQIIPQQNIIQQQNIPQQQNDFQQQDLPQEQDTPQQQQIIQDQDNSPPVIITTTQSLRNSTTSQEYKTPPVSPDIDDISDLNSEDIRELEKHF